MSNNLDLDQMADGQASPEVTHNDSNGQLDAAITETHTADVSAGNVTLTSTQYRRAMRVDVVNGAAARDVTLPAVKKMAVVTIDSGNTNQITLKVGSTSVILNPGTAVVAYTDGTANGLECFGLNNEARAPFDINAFIPGLPADGSNVLFLSARRAFRLPINLTGSIAKSRVAADATADFDIKKNGSSIGTISFAAAATTATLTFAAAVSFAIGDELIIEAPSPQDVDLADVYIGLLGERL
jgi:hypothetical protein